MFKKNKRHRVPTLNATSTSDISFTLLIFFLVTTSIDNEKGLARRLPPPPEDGRHTEMAVSSRNTLRVAIDDDGHVTSEGRTVSLDTLRTMVAAFVENRNNAPDMPEKQIREIPLLGRCAVTAGHVIALEVSRKADYNAYFHVQEAIVAAYTDLRDRLSRSRFGHPYAECTPDERDALAKYYPQRISETEPDGEGGKP